MNLIYFKIKFFIIISGNLAPEFSSFNQPTSPNSNKKNEEDAIKTLGTDKNEPTTKIQVRLADGTKYVAKEFLIIFFCINSN